MTRLYLLAIVTINDNLDFSRWSGRARRREMVVTHRRRQGGPPLVLLALVSSALVVAGVIAGTATAGALAPSAWSSSTAVVGFVRAHGDAVRVTSVLWFGSAIPLAIYAATAHARLRNLGVRAPGATAWLLAASLSWVLARPEVASNPAVVRALSDAAYALGGPATLAGLGLLVAGMSVPAFIVGLLPRSLAGAGLALAASAEVASVLLLVTGAWPLRWVLHGVLLAWLVASGALLVASRPAPAPTPERPPAPALAS
jgi:hypothetical protein